MQEDGTVVAGEETEYYYGEDNTRDVEVEATVYLSGESSKTYEVSVSVAQKQLTVPFTATVTFEGSD